jgi:hypothetical protein
MQTIVGMLLLLSCALLPVPASTEPKAPSASPAGVLLPAIVIPIRFTMPAASAQQTQQVPPSGYSGNYRPVPQQPYQRKCGTIATDVCPTDVTVPPGATGEQVYQMAVQAQQQGRRNDAMGYLIKSADLGYARAQSAIGIDYADGKGMTHDPRKAVYYLGLAAQQGNRGAQAKLGEIYELGEGVPADQARAIELYKASAAQHDSDAEFALGVDYEFGNGLPRNRSLAIQYLRQSSADGGDTYGSDLAGVLARVPPSRQFHSFDELFAYMHPPAKPRTGGQCGGTPLLYAGMNRFGFNQIMTYCRDHTGCPNTIVDGGVAMHCY